MSATAAYLYDVTDLVGEVAPRPRGRPTRQRRSHQHRPRSQPGRAHLEAGHGAAGWGDAAVHVPWELYLATARTDVLADQFESMKRWVDFAVKGATLGRHPSRVERATRAARAREVSVGQRLALRRMARTGCEHGHVFAQLFVDDHGPVATAYLYRSADQLTRIAELLGDPEAMRRYAQPRDQCARRVAPRVHRRRRPRPTANAGEPGPRPRLRPRPRRAPRRAAADLVALIRAADTHLGTGFLATPFLLPVLADHGHLDVAYELLFQTTEPSWLHMTERTTTIWEDWDAVRPDGTVTHSLNHYSKGAVISFLHGYVAGLQLIEPGYRRFRVVPRPGGGITGARTHHDSPQGRIEVAWHLTDDEATSTSPSPSAPKPSSSFPTAVMTLSAPANTAAAARRTGRAPRGSVPRNGFPSGKAEGGRLARPGSKTPAMGQQMEAGAADGGADHAV